MQAAASAAGVRKFDAVADLSRVMRIPGSLNGKGDHRFVRGRIAMLVWLPSLIVLAMLSVWLQNAIPIVVGIPALLIGMWLFVGRSERVAALARRLYRR